jgi:salicylate hydroxylase
VVIDDGALPPDLRLITIPRKELLGAIRAAAEQAGVVIKTGSEVIGATARGELQFAAGRTEAADLAIGADGIWSTVRQHLFPQVKPVFSGLIAWRGTLEATQLPREYASRRVQLWMGPNAHLVVYPISGGRQINVVAVVPGTWNRPGWSTPGDGNELKNIFGSPRWPGPARMVIGAVDAWMKFAMFTLPEGGDWTRGTIALLGDAAHAMLPFAAQGAGMAIEDAAVLAECLAGAADSSEAITAALKRYARLRRARVTRVQHTARRNGTIYHLTGPAALARDLAIRAMGPRRVLAQQNWIYDWRV